MQTLLLPGATKSTSRIGLGCGRLTGGAGFRASAAVVETALELGIRHFDVAPSYGLGLAEDMLGQVIGHDGAVSVATKAGIPPPKAARTLSLIRAVVKPLVANLPQVKARLAAAAGAAPKASADFTVVSIEASFERSLKALRRDHVDVFLLHEPPADVPDEIEKLLADLRARARIGAYGVGTGRDAAALPATGRISQHLWSPDSARADDRMPIRHGLFRYWLPRLQSVLPSDSDRRRALSAQLGFDLDDATTTPALLLTLALSVAQDEMLLISSNSPARLRAVVKGVEWEAARGEKPDFLDARNHLFALMGEAAHV